jgi:hypothetical protein
MMEVAVVLGFAALGWHAFGHDNTAALSLGAAAAVMAAVAATFQCSSGKLAGTRKSGPSPLQFSHSQRLSTTRNSCLPLTFSASTRPFRVDVK